MKIFKILFKFASLTCFSIVALVIFTILFSLSLSQIRSWYVGGPNQRSLNGSLCLDIDDEFEYFYNSSGLIMPIDAEIILSCDDHGGFHGDGEYYIVFRTSDENIDFFLEQDLWEVSWQVGPIPEQIRRTALADEFSDVFDSSEIFYIVRGNTLEGPLESYEWMRFYNGRLLVIDPAQKRIFYSKWDF